MTCLPTLSSRNFFILHLMHLVGSHAAARIPASESDQAMMLLEMLDGERNEYGRGIGVGCRF